MPAQSLTLLKAGRIAEARMRTEAAEQDLNAASTQLDTAMSALAAAKTASQRTAAEATLAAAKDQLTHAKQRLDYENDHLEHLLRCDHDDSWKAQYAVFGILSSIVIGFLMYGIVNKPLLASLANIDTARGLITFLFTVVTVTIALILLLSTVVSHSPDRVQRFLDGKDLLFALIGVLGTIVGFYFGQTTGIEDLRIAPPYVSSDNPDEGDTVTLVTFAYGGAAPYTYSISFRPDNVVPDVKEARSETGEIAAIFTAPKVDSDKQISFSISVNDSKGRTVFYDSQNAGKTVTLQANVN
jgi:outer membrane murein-binding lipoprotein Lpp